MSEPFTVKKAKRRISCNDFLYSDGKVIKRLSEWRDIYGTQATFTYELGNLNKILVTDEIKFSGENQLAVLTKVEN